MSRSAGMVDGADSKSAEGNLMGVRVPPSAPNKSRYKRVFLLLLGTHWALPNKHFCVWNPHLMGRAPVAACSSAESSFHLTASPPSTPNKSRYKRVFYWMRGQNIQKICQEILGICIMNLIHHFLFLLWNNYLI